MKFLTIVLALGLFLGAGCDKSPPSGHGPSQPSGPAKEKFFRGDMVVYKLDQRHGIIVGKHYVTSPEHHGGPHDCWLYEVRFSGKEPNSQLQLVDGVGEFELDKAENK